MMSIFAIGRENWSTIAQQGDFIWKNACAFEPPNRCSLGDSKDKPGTASRGCIILGPEVREAILKSGATVLEVVR
jgi:hypothetical protein